MVTPEELNQIRTIMREEIQPVRDEVNSVRQELKAVDERLYRYLLDFRTEMIQPLSDLNQRLSNVANAVNSLEMRLPAVSQAVIKLETRVYEHPSPTDLKLADLEAQLRKLEGAA